jgi:hypothetical protein
MFRQIEHIISQSTPRGGARRAANQIGGINTHKLKVPTGKPSPK